MTTTTKPFQLDYGRAGGALTSSPRDSSFTLYYTLLNAADGTVLQARTATGVVDLGEGQYSIAPVLDVAWEGVLVWDDDSGDWSTSEAFGPLPAPAITVTSLDTVVQIASASATDAVIIDVTSELN